MQTTPIGFYFLGGFDIVFGLWLGLWGFRYEYNELARWFHFALGALFVVPGFVTVWWASERKPLKKPLFGRTGTYSIVTVLFILVIMMVDMEETRDFVFALIILCFFAGNAILSWKLFQRSG